MAFIDWTDELWVRLSRQRGTAKVAKMDLVWRVFRSCANLNVKFRAEIQLDSRGVAQPG
jgi:hypothetical protein